MIQPADYDLPPMIKRTNYEFGYIVKVDGVARNLTDCTIEVVLSNVDGVVDTLNSEHYLSVYADQGAITLDIPPSVLVSYPSGELTYKTYITEPNGETNLYVEGRIQVRE